MGTTFEQRSLPIEIGRRGLTDRQALMLDLIKESIVERGYPPTMRELGLQMGIASTNGVEDHLRALERKGYIAREEMKGRTLRVLEQDGTPTPVPISERAALTDKIPIYSGLAAIGTPVDHIAPPSGRRAHLAVICRADALSGLGIITGDVLYIQKRLAESGEVVVVQVDGEILVRIIFYEGNMVRLSSRGDQRAPIMMKATHLPMAIVGVVVAMFRPIGERENETRAT